MMSAIIFTLYSTVFIFGCFFNLTANKLLILMPSVCAMLCYRLNSFFGLTAYLTENTLPTLVTVQMMYDLLIHCFTQSYF